MSWKRSFAILIASSLIGCGTAQKFPTWDGVLYVGKPDQEVKSLHGDYQGALVAPQHQLMIGCRDEKMREMRCFTNKDLESLYQTYVLRECKQ